MTLPDHTSPSDTSTSGDTATSTDLPHYLHPLRHGIYVVDTGFEREHFDAAYLVVQDGRAAFIDATWSLKKLDLGGFEINATTPDRNASRFVELTLVGRDGRFIR